MKKVKWYRFTFSDGYEITVRGFSKTEMKQATFQHGAVRSKVFVGTF